MRSEPCARSLTPWGALLDRSNAKSKSDARKAKTKERRRRKRHTRKERTAVEQDQEIVDAQPGGDQGMDDVHVDEDQELSDLNSDDEASIERAEALAAGLAAYNNQQPPPTPQLARLTRPRQHPSAPQLKHETAKDASADVKVKQEIRSEDESDNFFAKVKREDSEDGEELPASEALPWPAGSNAQEQNDLESAEIKQEVKSEPQDEDASRPPQWRAGDSR